MNAPAVRKAIRITVATALALLFVYCIPGF